MVWMEEKGIEVDEGKGLVSRYVYPPYGLLMRAVAMVLRAAMMAGRKELRGQEVFDMAISFSKMMKVV